MPLLPEFCVLKGDLLLELPTNSDDPERWFQRAYDLAKDLDARMSQLRAAVRLCRVWQERGNPALGANLLRDVYNTFTEGFATTDLIEAKGLLTSPSLRAQ